MRAAAQHAQGGGGFGLDVQGPARAVGIAAKRAGTARRRVHDLARRCMHDAEHRLTMLHERDIDGKFAIAFDELARAIERIDQP